MVDRLKNSEENSKRIRRVENCFGSFGTPLLTPGRVLVGEGALTKMCRKKPKPRQFFLFNDILVYGSILTKKKFGQQKIIPLVEIEIEDVEDSAELKNGWLIKTPSKSFAVLSSTSTEKYEWMAHIRKCVDQRIAQTGKRPGNNYAPQWIPDTEVTCCMVCNKTQFNVINRRHHCRNCGKCICKNCSKNRFLLPSQSDKPVRVCDACYRDLTELQTANTSNISDQTNNNNLSKDDDSGDSDPDGINGLKRDFGDMDINQKPTFYNDDAHFSAAAEHEESLDGVKNTKKVEE